MAYIYYSWYVLLSGKLKLSETFTIFYHAFFFLFFPVTDLAVHKLVGGETFNESQQTLLLCLSHGQAERWAAKGHPHPSSLHVSLEWGAAPLPAPAKFYIVTDHVKDIRQNPKPATYFLFLSPPFMTSLIFRFLSLSQGWDCSLLIIQ